MSRRACHALLLALLLPSAACAETCRYAGTTSQDGRLAVQTDVRQADGLTTVDVTLEFTIHAWMTDYRYLAQEITTWRGAELRSIAINQRSLADGDIKRQQWDVFTREGAVFAGSRVQAKYLADFRERHSGFVAHWSPASFGQPWLADYRRASPVRRPDLDLPTAGTRTPLAFAFVGSRFLPQAGVEIALVLPSFKQNKTVALRLAPAMPDRALGEGVLRWSSALHHAALETSPASLVAAWVSPGHDLVQLGFDIHTAWVAGTAIFRPLGCQGVQIDPNS